jgi:hypothetical protein
VVYTKGITKFKGIRLGFPMHATTYISIHIFFHPRLGPFWHSGLPVNAHLPNHQVDARTPSPRISTAPWQEVILEGGRNHE